MAEPTDPTEARDPTDPMDRIDPFELILRRESDELIDQRDPRWAVLMAPVCPARRGGAATW